jgi:hypothetical protein
MISGYLVVGLFGFAVGAMLGVHTGYRMGHREGRWFKSRVATTTENDPRSE